MYQAPGKRPLYEACEEFVEFAFALRLAILFGLNLLNTSGKFLLEGERLEGLKQFSVNLLLREFGELQNFFDGSPFVSH